MTRTGRALNQKELKEAVQNANRIPWYNNNWLIAFVFYFLGIITPKVLGTFTF